jgi:ankyrin repeat protein
VAKGANVNAVDLSGCTPLLIAAQYGHADVVAYLVKIRADTTILDKNQDSAMHWAAYKGPSSHTHTSPLAPVNLPRVSLPDQGIWKLWDSCPSSGCRRTSRTRSDRSRRAGATAVT